MQLINMNYFYMCINVNQDGMLYVFIHWKYRVRRINPNLKQDGMLYVFFIENTNE